MSERIYGNWETSEDGETWEVIGDAIGERVRGADGSQRDTWSASISLDFKQFARVAYLPVRPVIDLTAARERRTRRAVLPLHLKAIDALALALAEHDHAWSDEERSLYEASVAKLSEML